MKPLSREIKKDDHEIEKCEWIPLEKYFQMTHLRKVQLAAKEAVQRYIRDSSKCLTLKDISHDEKHKVSMYSCEY